MAQGSFCWHFSLYSACILFIFEPLLACWIDLAFSLAIACCSIAVAASALSAPWLAVCADSAAHSSPSAASLAARAAPCMLTPLERLLIARVVAG